MPVYPTGRMHIAPGTGAVDAVPIENCSGLYGDRLSAVRDMLSG